MAKEAYPHSTLIIGGRGFFICTIPADLFFRGIIKRGLNLPNLLKYCNDKHQSPIYGGFDVLLKQSEIG